MKTFFCTSMAYLRLLDGIPALAIRLYLVPIMLQAGWQKALHFNNTVQWFADHEWGLGLPFPTLLAALATSAEIGGAICLLLGLCTRLATIPLIITMAVAIVTVHAPYGWLAIADAHSWFADGTLWLDERVQQAPEKLAKANALLAEHGHYDWLTASGKLVVLNNGMEFAATYLVMLLTLLSSGGGRYVSVDYYLARCWRR